jgi:hypothetical protein
MKKRPNAINRVTAIPAFALMFCLAPYLRAFDCVANPTAHTYQESSSNPTIRVFVGTKQYEYAEVVVTESTVENGVEREFLRQYAGSDGVVRLSALREGWFYVLSTADIQGRYLSLALHIVKDAPSSFEIKLPESSQPPRLGSLRGTVIDPSGAVLQKVKIQAKPIGVNSGEVLESATSSQGQFVLDVPDGEYRLTFVERGFYAAQFSVVIKANSRDSWKALRLKMMLGVEDCAGTRPRFSIEEATNVN